MTNMNVYMGFGNNNGFDNALGSYLLVNEYRRSNVDNYINGNSSLFDYSFLGGNNPYTASSNLANQWKSNFTLPTLPTMQNNNPLIALIALLTGQQINTDDEPKTEPTLPAKNIDKEVFDKDGSLLSKTVTNENGTTVKTHYDKEGNVVYTSTEITLEDGTKEITHKDVNGNSDGSTTIKDGEAKRYDKDGKLLWITKPEKDGQQEVIYYNADGSVKETATRISREDGKIVDNRKDADGKDLGHKVYDKNMKILHELIKNDDGTETIKTYDNNQNLTKIATRTHNEDGSYTDVVKDTEGKNLYSANVKDGVLKGYDANGNLSWEDKNNEDGTKDITWYNPDGSVRETSHRVLEENGGYTDNFKDASGKDIRRERFDKNNVKQWEVKNNDDGTNDCTWYNSKGELTERAVRTKNADGTNTDIFKDNEGNTIKKCIWDADGYKIYDKDGNLVQSGIKTDENSKKITNFNTDGSIKDTINRIFEEDGTITDYCKDTDGSLVSTNKYDKNWRPLEKNIVKQDQTEAGAEETKTSETVEATTTESTDNLEYTQEQLEAAQRWAENATSNASSIYAGSTNYEFTL